MLHTKELSAGPGTVLGTQVPTVAEAISFIAVVMGLQGGLRSLD